MSAGQPWSATTRRPCRACILRCGPAGAVNSVLRECIAIDPANGNAIHAYEWELPHLQRGAPQQTQSTENDGYGCNGVGPSRPPIPQIGAPRPEVIDTIASIDAALLGRMQSVGRIACAHRRWRELPLLALQSAAYDRELLLSIVDTGAAEALAVLLGRTSIISAAMADDEGLWAAHSWTIFHRACASGSIPMVERLLNSELMTPQGRDIDFGDHPSSRYSFRGQWPGATGLHAAARCGRVDMLRWLVRQGANWRLGMKAHAGTGVVTPLHLAALAGSAESCAFLLQLGSSVNYRVDELKCFSNSRTGLTPLFLAAASGDVATVVLLLEHSAQVDACVTEDDMHVHERGITPLHMAARRNDWRVCELLCSAGADPLAAAYIRNKTINGGRKPWDGSAKLRPHDLATDTRTKEKLAAAKAAAKPNRSVPQAIFERLRL